MVMAQPLSFMKLSPEGPEVRPRTVLSRLWACPYIAANQTAGCSGSCVKREPRPLACRWQRAPVAG